MSITITLSLADRKAIDWIGHRYAHGTKLYRILWGKCEQKPDDADWDDPRDIEFFVPNDVARVISEIIEEDELCCFSDELQFKFYTLQYQIV